jgi:hypothetical protein
MKCYASLSFGQYKFFEKSIYKTHFLLSTFSGSKMSKRLIKPTAFKYHFCSMAKWMHQFIAETDLAAESMNSLKA